MEFSFTEEQSALRDLAAKILSARANDETLRGFVGAGDWIDRELWRELASAALIGLPLPEKFGGAGLGLLDFCILLEEQGRCLAPVPLLQTVLMGAWPVAELGEPAARERLLSGVAGGERILTAALYERGTVDVFRPRTVARPDGAGWRLEGIKECVPVAHIASFLLVSATTEQGLVLAAVDPHSSGVEMQRQETVNYEPQFLVRLDGVRVDADAVVVGPSRAEAVLSWLEQRTLVGLAAMQVGICGEALRRTASYAGERVQFGRPIGSFQGVSLRAADSYMAVEAMRSTMWQAAWRLDRGLPSQEACRVAKWWAAKGAHEVVHTTQHLHGGVGADVDYPVHRYFLWAKQVGMALGGEARQLQSLGRVIGDRAVAAVAGGREHG
jgi:alkylation response protein AidB-like acyl-CoA dehydrogenase